MKPRFVVRILLLAIIWSLSFPMLANPQLYWVKSSRIDNRHKPIVAIQIHDRHIFICNSSFNHGIHPGFVNSHHCIITYAGRVYKQDQYTVLVGNSRVILWKNAQSRADLRRHYYPATGVILNGMLSPHKPLLAPVITGYEHSPDNKKFHVLYTCRTFYGSHVYIGKVVSSRCNIAVNGNEISLPEYQQLYVSTRPLNSHTLFNRAWKIHPRARVKSIPRLGIGPIVPMEPGPVIIKPR